METELLSTPEVAPVSNADQQLGVELVELPGDEPLDLEASFEPDGPFIPIAASAVSQLIARVRHGDQQFIWFRRIDSEDECQLVGDSRIGLLVEARTDGVLWRRFLAPGGSRTIRYIRPVTGFVYRAPERECRTLATATLCVLMWLREGRRVPDGLVLGAAELWDEEIRAGFRRFR